MLLLTTREALSHPEMCEPEVEAFGKGHQDFKYDDYFSADGRILYNMLVVVYSVNRKTAASGFLCHVVT